MTLRMKTFSIIALLMACALATLYFTSEYTLINNYAHLEKETVEANITRALNAINQEICSLGKLVSEWAVWDDSYQFMGNRNMNFIQANLLDSVYSKQRINIFLCVDPEGKIIYGTRYDLQNNKRLPVSSELLKQITPDGLLLARAMKTQSSSGILSLPEGLLVFCANPILTSQGQGPPRGMLLLGRYLDEPHIKRLNNKINLAFTVSPYESNSNTNQVAALLRNGQPMVIKPLNEKKIAGYALLRDIYGQPASILKVVMPRSIYRQGLDSIIYFGYLLAAILIVFGIIMALLLERLVISQVSRLSSAVSEIGRSGDLSIRIPVTGNDELSWFTQNINHMLGDLEQAQVELKESREQYRQLFDEALSANYISTPDGTLLLCNPTYAQMFGFASVEEAMCAGVTALYPTPDLRAEFVELVRLQKSLHNYESTLVGKEGDLIDVLETVVGVFDENNELLELRGYMVDITQRKAAEEKVKYLSYHDRLTSLYNRAYFEQELLRYDRQKYWPITIIMGDVNGLKLVNDALGHDQGDRLLIEIARIIKESCRADDVVARWSGDEFLVLLPGTSDKAALDICERIRKKCEQVSIEGLNASISLGVASKQNHSVKITNLLKQAEERMYRNKLLQTQSYRNALLSSLGKTLQAKSHETEEHTSRLRDMVVQLGRVLGLSDNNLDELDLLAALHDIGKIAIPDNILLKPEALNPEEWDIMRKHSEIGYRIAQSSPEMAPIAEAILTHHERWDGNGYPLGLKKEQIPLISRIMAIADTYDVMIHDRPYRKARTREEAIEELRRCAGTQFDPVLVKTFINTIIGKPAS